jgi:hypothetical protein
MRARRRRSGALATAAFVVVLESVEVEAMRN